MVKAVGFTGSIRGGRALYDLAAKREEPIPVFAEMGSVNPVILLPNALINRAESIAQTYAGSITVGDRSILHKSRIDSWYKISRANEFCEYVSR